MSRYTLDFNISGMALSEDTAYNYLSAITATVFCGGEHAYRDPVGKVKCWLINIPAALNEGMDPTDLFQSNEYLESFYPYLFVQGFDTPSQLEQSFEYWGEEVILLVERMTLEREHRGYNLGLRALEHISRQFCTKGLLVLEAYAIGDYDLLDRRRHNRTLADYYAEIGFEQIFPPNGQTGERRVLARSNKFQHPKAPLLRSPGQ